MLLNANREKPIKCKTNKVKRNSSGRMKSASSFGDPRAWSLNPRKRTEYIFEAMAELASSSGSEDNSKETEDGKASESISMNRRLFLMSRGSHSADNILDETDQQVIKLNNKLFEAKEEIEELQTVKQNLMDEKVKTNAEIDNLRDLVKNMKGQMEYLQSLKVPEGQGCSEEELDCRKELERAKLEIDHLLRKVEMFSNTRKWNVEIRRACDKLTAEKTELSRRVVELQSEKSAIQEELNSREKAVAALEAKLKAAEESSTEKAVLRERIFSKDERIREMAVNLEKKSVAVEELTAKVTSLTESFKNKEDYLNQEVEDLRKSLEEKSRSIAKLEDKLHNTELLVAELETLRDQFRSMNIVLTESIKAYKKDIDGYVKTTEALNETVNQLREDNASKDKQIEKLTLFPQNPDTMLYFSHLNKLVTSVDRLELLTKDEQTDLLESVKSIIVRLKEEMWGGNITPLDLQIQDSNIQTEYEQTDRDIQCIPTVCSVVIQTNLPDEFMLKFKNSEEDVRKLNSKLITLERTLSTQAEELDTLETSMFDLIEDNHTKEITLENMARNNNLLQETMRTLNDELKNTDQMLINAMNELQQQAQSHRNSTNILETTLSNTIDEYSRYVAVFEAYLEQKDEKITEMQSLMDQQTSFHQEQSEKADKETEQLRDLLAKEEQLTNKLKMEVNHLLGSLNEKSNSVREMEIKLDRAEKTIEKLIENDDEWTESTKDGNSGDYVSSLGSQVASYKRQVAKFKVDIVKQRQACEAFEGEVAGLRRAKKRLRKAVSRSCVQKRELAQRLRKVRSCLTKSKRRERVLKMEYAKVDKTRSDLSESVDNLTLENGVLKKERGVLMQEMYVLKCNLNDLDKCVEKHKERYTQHEELKMKMEKQVLKLMKKITKYKTALSVKRDEEENASRSYERALMSEKLNHEIDLLKTENMSLSTTICSLKQKLSSLLELPEKESSSVELQVSLEEQIKDEYNDRRSSEDESTHYENIIAAMKKEHESAADQSHRQYMNNLKMLKDTYERDIAALKKSHSENLEKMKAMQIEELKYLHLKQKRAELELEKSKIEELFAKEAADLRSHYEGRLKETETRFENEKIKLVRDMSAVKDDLIKQVQCSIEEIENLKANFERQVEKLEGLHRREMELAKKRFEKNVDREIEKRMWERREKLCEREVQSDAAEYQDRGTDPEDPINLLTDLELLLQCCEAATNLPIQKPIFNFRNNQNFAGVLTTEDSTNTDSCAIYQTFSEVNCQERVSCEIKEESSKTILSVLPVASIDGPDKALLMARINELENKLQTTRAETTRKLKFYEKKMKHEQMKAREIANILDQELRYSTDVHCKLGLQYNRAEQLELEKEMLASRLQLCEQELNLIRNMKKEEGFHAITSSYKERIGDTENSLELAQSINRLKRKIEKAEIQEQRLSDRLMRSSELVDTKYERGDDQIPQKEYEEAHHNESHPAELKVIVIQERKVTHSWRSNLDDVY